MRLRLDVCIGCIIAGIIITAIGVYAALVDFPGSTWEIMGNKVPPSEWGWPFAIFGIILLLIGVFITYYSIKKK
jgi:ABC-type antimicrobial peptide transport system permease subunit